MVAKVTLHNAGRIVLPKPLRDGLQLAPGDTLELESSSEGLTFCPVQSAAPLQKERGVWVFRTGQRLPASAVNEVLREVRNERLRANLGNEAR
jgi:AbrB family looped-hinge helix DNA binding protein